VKNVVVAVGKQFVVEYKNMADRKCNVNGKGRRGDKYKTRSTTGAVQWHVLKGCKAVAGEERNGKMASYSHSLWHKSVFLKTLTRQWAAVSELAMHSPDGGGRCTNLCKKSWQDRSSGLPQETRARSTGSDASTGQEEQDRSFRMIRVASGGLEDR